MSIIIAHHIAKTGGTSLMHHVRAELGDDTFFGIGKHTASHRFFRQQPLWSELTGDDVAKIRLTLGHNVGVRAVLSLPADTSISFFVCLRDPVTHMLSQYHHRLIALHQRGQTLTLDEFLAQRQTDRVSREIWSTFKPLTPWAEYGEVAVMRILSMFEHIGITENLADSTGALCAQLGISPLTRHERVSQFSTEVTAAQRAQMMALSPLDRKIYDMLTQHKRKDTPVAFNPALLADKLVKYRSKHRHIDVIADEYRDLAGFMEHRAELEAARLFLTLSGLKDAKYEPIWSRQIARNFWANIDYRLRSDLACANIFRRFGHVRQAEMTLRNILTVKPEFAAAKRQLADMLWCDGRQEEAHRLAGEAIAYMPRDKALKRILTNDTGH